MNMLRFFPEFWLCARAVFNEIDGEPMNRYALELHRRDVPRKASPAHQREMAAARAVLNGAVVPPADSATLTQLIAMFRQREQIGLAKYGTTVDRTDLSLGDWLQHALEESMDRTLYIKRAIDELPVWRPIATAPKDGERILVAEYSGYVHIVAWCRDGYWRSRSDEENLGWWPVRWMPLPVELGQVSDEEARAARDLANSEVSHG